MKCIINGCNNKATKAMKVNVDFESGEHGKETIRLCKKCQSRMLEDARQRMSWTSIENSYNFLYHKKLRMFFYNYARL